MINEQKRKRIEWVDIAKGVAIVLVCLGHRNIPGWMTKWIYTFHLPAFFFLSGYTTNYSSYNGFLDFFKRKAKGLIIPYFSLGALYILIEFAWEKIYRGGILLWVIFAKTLFRTRNRQQLVYCGIAGC